MKTIILILWLINGNSVDVAININIGETCDDALYKVVKWKENPNYKPFSYEVWGYYTYNNKPIFAHTCMETNKINYFYYNKGKNK
jgi:hypothetical protein